MATRDWKNAPADPESVATLAAGNLEYRLVDPTDRGVLDPYLQAENRGFLGGEHTAQQLDAERESVSFRRFIGVYDPTSLDVASPVGTVCSWVADLSLPGRQSIPMWAISGVTVAPTHRRRGIARAMLEGELRTAAGAGFAIAGLTVSEATIYGRFGFSPATFATRWTIDTRRARWIGPRPQGRLDFVDRERLVDEIAPLHLRTVLARPGEIDAWPGYWQRLAGLAAGQENGGKIRAVRYADDAGATRGMVVYRLSEEGADFTQHELEVLALISETPDAYAALWRFVLEHDLVTTVKASLRSTDEALRWMIADQRGAKVTIGEHHWLRILDVPTVLSSRTYAAGGSFVLRVTDPLGHADGAWRLSIDAEGKAVVWPLAGGGESGPDVDVTLSVGSLSSILLGGVRAATLRDAGLVEGELPTIEALDASFATPRAAHLSFWY